MLDGFNQLADSFQMWVIKALTDFLIGLDWLIMFRQ